MFEVTQDETVLGGDGRVIYFGFDKFISDIAQGNCCFICGVSPGTTPFNDEHVVPNWLLRRFELHSRRIEIPNRSDYPYGRMTIPCCVRCNAEMGERFERPMRTAFDGGFEAVSRKLQAEGPWDLFRWMGLIFLKAHLKNKYLNYHRDRRKGHTKISETHPWEELHHLHCVVRSFHSGAKIQQEVLGSLCIFPAKLRPHFEGFDFVDLTVPQTMLLCVDDIAVVAVFNDSQGALTIAEEHFRRRIGGPLSPIQLREIAARLAAINLQFTPRPRFFSDIDAVAEDYRIRVERPEEVHIPLWNDELFGSIMHELTKDMINGLRDGEAILNQVKTGLYTFLTTPSGDFDINSMELEEDTNSAN